MRTIDNHRIEAQLQHARIVDMHLALQRLRSIVSFMNSGAHPDDETSAMLAALGHRDGLDISYACANRGEGGQNDIGTEAGATLGTLRTAEMEKAAEALNMRLYWLSTQINDSIFDFRFSKSGVETLARWGHEHTLNRFVSIVRREKPDVLCPTFLDIPGQHGHHRAMTQLAHEVIEAAADPTYTVNHHGQPLPAWQVVKLYLPAWGGGGTAYDDELPPPPATLTVNADGVDSVTGWSWEQIGQQSRRYHLTQGMGRWIAAGAERNWPLHLAYSSFNGSDSHVTDHLPSDLNQLADYAGASSLKDYLTTAQQHINDALQSFPDYNAILVNANKALRQVTLAQQNCPADVQAQVQHRLIRKVEQLSRVIRIAAGIDAQATAERDQLRPDEQVNIVTELRFADPAIRADISSSLSISVDDDWMVKNNNTLKATHQAPPTDPYPCEYFPDRARPPSLALTLIVDGVTSQTQTSMVNTPVILAAQVVNLSRESVIINRQTDIRTFSLLIESQYPESGNVSLTTPHGWSCTSTNNNLVVTVPDDVPAGTYELQVLLNGAPASSEQLIEYPHINKRVLARNATIKVLVLDVTLPDKRIAYIGGGNDRVAAHIRAMGLPVKELDDSALQSGRDLCQFDTLVIGLFAMRTRPVISQNLKHIHDWVASGGHLVTLYHRPWDNWDPHTAPPRKLEIGQPSLRFRVTDENAEVTHLIPDHPLLNHPNRITPADWHHWRKERGLYFARSWHEDYQALLSMHDPDEAPLHGSLLSAVIGSGRHTHTSLVLHHQMANLVPGGFRLMANLLG